MRRAADYIRSLPLLATALLAMAAQDGAAQPDGENVPPHNVILLLADTLRADHMSVYGYHRSTTPALEKRARQAVIFERARSQSACTPTSVASLLTSRYPAEVAGGTSLRFGVPRSVRSLSEILRAAGMRTIAISASQIVRKTPSRFNPGGDFDRGFQVFDDEICENREAGFLNERALEHLENIREPFFLYVHYMDPHHPYQPPAGRRRRFLTADLSKSPTWLQDGNPDPIARLIRGRAQDGDKAAKLEQVPILLDLYDEEILYLDGEIDGLLETLEGRGLLENSIVIFASDHGEMFLEQGALKHCRELWDTVTRTPLMLWIPGVEGGHRVRTAVENIDIVPTVLDYLGIRRRGLHGESLRPSLERRGDKTGLAFSSQSALRSVDDGRFKLILNVETGDSEVYDLETDPFERKDVSGQNRDAGRRLRAALDTWLTKHAPEPTEKPMVQKRRQVEERLRSLGYLQ